MGENEINNWQVKPTANDVALAARDIIVDAAAQAIQARGIFKIVLAGGTTPKQIYSLLAEESCHWEQWRIYLGDERCLPVDDPERNSQMIESTFLDKVDFHHKNIHFIPAELGAVEATAEYEQIVHAALPFDLVMLGVGEDGHTASLFPEHQHNENEWVHAVFNAPKAPADRVSMSTASLSQNRTLLRLITGASKYDAVKQWGDGKDLPIARISTLDNEITLLDQSATGKA
ncbi:MAG: 6-phosphogluconolactonase [Cocleimonas sp.]|nr:6-phosphogluconolactonase [Cocleimonas sp.]